MKIAMIAAKAFPYGGRRISAGEQFFANGQRDARLLTALGRAAAHSYTVPDIETSESLDEVVQPWQREAEITEVAATPVEPAPIEVPRVKRQYRRRDMTAEGEGV